MNNRARQYSVKFFFISLVIALTCFVMATPSVHALPITGTFEVTFNQVSPTPIANAGHGTFTATAGVVNDYEFEFTSPIAEDFEDPPPLTWNGTSLSGAVFGEYIFNAFLQFFGPNSYEISVPQVFYFDNYLGNVCGVDGMVGNCLTAVGTYSVTQVVPEPSSLVLLAIGLALNSIRRRSMDSNARRSRHQ